MQASFAIRGRYVSAFLAANTLCYTSNTHLMFFDCKIGDFKTAGRVCLQKTFVYRLSYKVFFGDFLNYALKSN